jgi:hypothetical protein
MHRSEEDAEQQSACPLVCPGHSNSEQCSCCIFQGAAHLLDLLLEGLNNLRVCMANNGRPPAAHIVNVLRNSSGMSTMRTMPIRSAVFAVKRGMHSHHIDAASQRGKPKLGSALQLHTSCLQQFT